MPQARPLPRKRERPIQATQLAAGAAAFLPCDLCMLVLWTEVWWDFDLAWLAAMTGDATSAAAGRTKTSAAIRRLNEEFTSICSGGVEGARQLNSRGEGRALID